MSEPEMITMAPCPYCGQVVPATRLHDCRQLQISQLREEVAALRAQVEALTMRTAMESPLWGTRW